MKEYQKEIKLEEGDITISGFYDEEWESWRYSWSSQQVGCYMGSGGYMSDNSVAYPTKDSALESAICAICGFDKEKRRDLRLKLQLEI